METTKQRLLSDLSDGSLSPFLVLYERNNQFFCTNEIIWHHRLMLKMCMNKIISFFSAFIYLVLLIYFSVAVRPAVWGSRFRKLGTEYIGWLKDSRIFE